MKISNIIYYTDAARVSVTTSTNKENKTNNVSSNTKGSTMYIAGRPALEISFSDEQGGWFVMDNIQKNVFCYNILAAVTDLKSLFNTNEHGQTYITDINKFTHLADHYDSSMFIKPVVLGNDEKGFRLFPNNSINGGWVLGWMELKSVVDTLLALDMSLYSLVMMNTLNSVTVEEEEKLERGSRGNF